MKAILFLMLLAGFFGCFFADTTATLGAEFTLKKNETATIKTTNARLKMLSAGQAQSESGGDRPFCKFEISSKNKTEEKTVSVGKTTQFENLNIKVISVDTKANPNASDPWSNTSCGFIVTKNR